MLQSNPLPKVQNSGLLVVPRIAKSTKGGRTFSYLSPKLWNSLPEKFITIYIYIYYRNLISCKAALERLNCKKRYVNNLEFNWSKYIQFILTLMLGYSYRSVMINANKITYIVNNLKCSIKLIPSATIIVHIVFSVRNEHAELCACSTIYNIAWPHTDHDLWNDEVDELILTSHDKKVARHDNKINNCVN